MGDEDLSLSVLSTSAPRGGKFTVKVTGDRSGYRAVRVELLLLERKLKATFEKERHPVVLTSVDVPDGQDVVEVFVPRFAPNAYDGETIAWDYELKVVGDQLGRDDHDEMPVTITAEQPVDLAGSGVVLQSSKATVLTGIGKSPNKSLYSMALWLGGTGIFCLLLGLSGDKIVFTVGGGLLLGLAGYAAFRAWSYLRNNLEGVAFDVPNRSVRLGEPITALVADTSSKSLEVGIVAIEYYIVHGKNSDMAVAKTVHEHWVPLVGRQVQLPTAASQPSGYPGKEIALHWMVGIRESGLSTSRQLFTQRLIPVAITH